MKLAEIVRVLNLRVVAGEDKLETQVTGGYVSDLLSNVMSQACAGSLWITLQGHQNIVAVAALTNLAGVLVAGGAPIEQAAIRKAQTEGVVLMTTGQSTFEVAGRLYALLTRGQ